MSPQVSTQAGASALENQAYQQGQQAQQQYNAQSQQLKGQYNQDVNTSNQYGSNLENYAKNMQSGTSIYNNALSQAQNQYGLNNVNFQGIAKNLTNSQNIMASLPQAVNQMSGYSGATAGQVAQNYSNLQNNIGGAVANANNSMKNELGYVQAAQNQANQGTQAQLSNQQTRMQGYTQAYTQAVNQMQTAGSTMAQIESQAQQQGNLTAQQVSDYQNAYSTYVQSQAAMTRAQATAQYDAALTAQTWQAVNAAKAAQSNASGGTPSNWSPKGGKPTANASTPAKKGPWIPLNQQAGNSYLDFMGRMSNGSGLGNLVKGAGDLFNTGAYGLGGALQGLWNG